MNCTCSSPDVYLPFTQLLCLPLPKICPIGNKDLFLWGQNLSQTKADHQHFMVILPYFIKLLSHSLKGMPSLILSPQTFNTSSSCQLIISPLILLRKQQQYKETLPDLPPPNILTHVCPHPHVLSFCSLCCVLGYSFFMIMQSTNSPLNYIRIQIF